MYYVTATNGGFSAIIDPNGWIQEVGKRGAAEAVEGKVYVEIDRERQPTTPYHRFGDWYALPLAMVVLLLVGFSFWERKQAKKQAGWGRVAKIRAANCAQK